MSLVHGCHCSPWNGWMSVYDVWMVDGAMGMLSGWMGEGGREGGIIQLLTTNQCRNRDAAPMLYASCSESLNSPASTVDIVLQLAQDNCIQISHGFLSDTSTQRYPFSPAIMSSSHGQALRSGSPITCCILHSSCNDTKLITKNIIPGIIDSTRVLLLHALLRHMQYFN